MPDIFEDGLPHPAQAYVKVCSSLSEASLDEETDTKTPPFKHPSPDHHGTAIPPTGIAVQRRSVLHTEEIVRDNFYTCVEVFNNYILEMNRNRNFTIELKHSPNL